MTICLKQKDETVEQTMARTSDIRTIEVTQDHIMSSASKHFVFCPIELAIYDSRQLDEDVEGVKVWSKVILIYDIRTEPDSASDPWPPSLRLWTSKGLSELVETFIEEHRMEPVTIELDLTANQARLAGEDR